MLGPGKFDKEAQELLERLQAHGIILLVMEGERGTGLSVKSDKETLRVLPKILRATADMIESEVLSDYAKVSNQR